MKIGEIWKLRFKSEESPLVPVQDGKLLSFDMFDEADNFILLPVRIKLIRFVKDSIEAIEYPDKKQAVEYPDKNEVSFNSPIIYHFTHNELISCYQKDWEN